jgi:hypothetical protein
VLSFIMVYQAPPSCPKYLVDALERAVNALPASWPSASNIGEVFATITDYERRLRGYCLAEGFDIVRTGGGTRAAPGARFSCIFHGKETRNWRKLEDHVERDKSGHIISSR